ncbi:MAG: hypothetical protein IT379_19625 [Deltaproteobacteria bacterium]|nr:hypothetical protein [Deltaproteobacteria bacterium]
MAYGQWLKDELAAAMLTFDADVVERAFAARLASSIGSSAEVPDLGPGGAATATAAASVMPCTLGTTTGCLVPQWRDSARVCWRQSMHGAPCAAPIEASAGSARRRGVAD